MAYRDLFHDTSSADLLRQQQAAENERLWLESERILNLLRTKGTGTRLSNEETLKNWQARRKLWPRPPPSTSSDSDFTLSSTPQKTPNKWFRDRFPREDLIHGPAFHENHTVEMDFVGGMPERRIYLLDINQDFFAGLVGAHANLGHEVVFFLPEQRFYFYDPTIGGFCPTSPEKLQLLVSNLLMRCFRDMGGQVDAQPLFGHFRSTEILRPIVTKAKALLAAEKGFFDGKDGRRRLDGDKLVDVTMEDPCALFVRKAIKPDPDAHLTVTECYENYRKFCGAEGFAPVARQYFKGLIREVIEEEFGRKVRHDLTASSGRHRDGWKGIAVHPLALSA